MSDEVIPVRRLIMAHSRLKDPVEVELPWDLFPEQSQKELADLDKNKDGSLYFSVDGSSLSLRREIGFGDGTAKKFFRRFWALQGDVPFNDFEKDEPKRNLRRLENVKEQVYKEVILPILGDRTDLARWKEAQKILETLADPKHLYIEAREAIAIWKKSKNHSYLLIAEELLMEAKRFAAKTRWGREEILEDIERTLQSIQRPKLDRIDEVRFKKEIQKPYLLFATGAPVALLNDNLDREFLIHVRVPKNYPSSKIVEAINQQKPRLSPSIFKGQRDGEEFRLEARQIYRPPHIGPAQRAIIRKNRLSKVMFEEPGDYFFVSLVVKDQNNILKGRDLRKFDVVFDLPHGERTVPGSVVIHRKKDKEIKIVVASDLHISERDYEMKKIMIDSLKKEKSPKNQAQIERIERFYESFNEKVEAAVEIWNDQYRKGELDYVALAGDLVDFINIATTTADQGYRGTNIRRFVHILSKLEPPFFAKPGNHDHRILPYPQSVYKQRFTDLPELSVELKRYDAVRFPGRLILQLDGIKALMTRRFRHSGNDDLKLSIFPVEALRELLSGDPYKNPNDEGMKPHYRYVEPYEADVSAIGNRQNLYQARSNEDDFNQQRWGYEKLNEPVGKNLFLSGKTYLFDQHVNGKGARPAGFRHFVQTLERIQRSGETMILTSHYPAFYIGHGPDQTPDSQDALRGEVNWAWRLATWYYHYPNGDPVIPLWIAGHVHRYGEYHFSLKFHNSQEENQFRSELQKIFEKISRGTIKDTNIYGTFDALRKKYRLDQHLDTERHLDSKNGHPGLEVQKFNQDSKGWGKKNGTLFVNLPALGPMTPDSPSGFLKINVNAEGRYQVMPHYFYLEPNGAVLKKPGNNLPELNTEHRQGISQWQVRHRDPIVIPKDSDSFTPPPNSTPAQQRRDGFAGPPRFDVAPIICQYPREKICLASGIGLGVHSKGSVQASLEVTPLQVTLPLSRWHHSVWGINYWRLLVNYSTSIGGNLAVSLGLGIPEPFVFAGFKFHEGSNVYGGGVKLFGASSALIPRLSLFIYGQGDRKLLGGGGSLEWVWDWLSIKMRLHRHVH